MTSADDLFQLQREVASDLATILSIPMSTKERARLAKSPTSSFQAYDYYLKGQKYLDDTEDHQAPEFATESFRQSLRACKERAPATS